MRKLLIAGTIALGLMFGTGVASAAKLPVGTVSGYTASHVCSSLLNLLPPYYSVDVTVQGKGNHVEHEVGSFATQAEAEAFAAQFGITDPTFTDIGCS